MTNRKISPFVQPSHTWLACLLGLFIFTVIITQGTNNTGSDPRGTLLVSQALVQHGTIKLDAYAGTYLDTFAHQIHKKNGHIYNYFPLGTALVSAPFVAMFNAFGYDMMNDEHLAQIMLTALVNLLIAFILYKTARLYLSQNVSILLTGICWFGSSLASTVGTALWSHDFAFLFSSSAIFLTLNKKRPAGALTPLFIGACLFLAYLCRPTLALLSPFLLVYYFIHDKKSAFYSGLSLSFLLLLFMGWSMHEYFQILPDYYLPKRLDGNEFEKALYGNLLSPARGILIFSPFILISIILNLWLAPKNKMLAKLILITLAWPIAHLLSISQFPHWWAGWSFGSRLMVDALPGLYVGLFSSLAVMQQWKRTIYTPLLICGALSIYVNTYQGLFNPYGVGWNVDPNIDQHPEYLFDWHYPQFLHSKNRHDARLMEFRSQQLPEFKGLIDIDHNSTSTTFVSFSYPEPGFRWSEGKSASLGFLVSDPKLLGEASLQAAFLGSQEITIIINDLQVYTGHFNGGDLDIRFSFPSKTIKPGLNTVQFLLPNAHRPASTDPRELAMALRKLSLR